MMDDEDALERLEADQAHEDKIETGMERITLFYIMAAIFFAAMFFALSGCAEREFFNWMSA